MNYAKLESAIGNPSDWVYTSMDSNGGQCACGKKGIVYRYHIKNKNTGSLAIVGSECIKYFESVPLYAQLKLADRDNRKLRDMEKVAKEVLNLLPVMEKYNNWSNYLKNDDAKIACDKFLKTRVIEIKTQWLPDWLKSAKDFLRRRA